MGEDSEEQTWLPEIPEDGKKIWRYIDFTQLCSILEKESLWFNRVDMYNDPIEGSHSRKTVKTRRKRYQQKVKSLDLSMNKISLINALSQLISNFTKMARQSSYLNCWHLNEGESMAMWELYSTEDQGVAIQSRVGRIKEALREEGGFINGVDSPLPDTPKENIPLDKKFILGAVKYIDYDQQRTPEEYPLAPLFHKRLSYEHEQEFRVAITLVDNFMGGETNLAEKGAGDLDTENLTPGKYTEVDLDELIERIHIIPSSEDWFFDLTKMVVDRYGITPSIVHRSSLEEDPVF